LHAERARTEAVRRALIVERIDHEADAIVVIDVLARRQIRAHGLRLVVERDEHGVEIARIVGDVDVRTLARRRTVARHPLREAGYDRVAAPDRFRRRHVQEILERGRLVEEGDREGLCLCRIA
jgi:hypothetical protein